MASQLVSYFSVMFVMITLCHSLPVDTLLEKGSKSEIGVHVPESAKENLVTDKSAKIVEDDVTVTVFGANSDTEEHKIVKRSPNPGVLRGIGCPNQGNEYILPGGCIPCNGNCNIDYEFDETRYE